jgi:thiamine biosynthesis protein ThiI
VGFNQLEPEFDTVIIRLGGEIGIKAAWTRKLYERRLIANIKAVLKHHAIPYEALNRKFGRFYLRTSQAQNASQKLTKVFGISSVSPALETTSKLSDIIDKSLQIADSTFKKESSFAVRCRRVGKHAYTSQDVCREVGRQVLDAYSKRGLRVDLNHPDIMLSIEVREDKAYISTEVMRGVGGLPLGTQPKLVSLLKEDISLPVACWMVMKRGCPILLLHFNETPLNNESTNRTLKAAKTLFEWAIGFPRKVYIVSHGPNLAQIEQNCPKKLKCVLSKRMMYRIAEQVAEMEHAEGIVTGESFNEPASEALHVLSLQDEAAKHFPVYRPLIGLDTVEIDELARKIGTFKISSVRRMKKRETTPKQSGKIIKLKEVKEAEAKLNTDEMVEASLKSLRIIYL